MLQSVHFLSVCPTNQHGACLNVALTLEEARQCTLKNASSNAVSCLVILTSPVEIDSFFVRSASAAQRPFFLAAPYFPAGDSFRRGFDLFLSVPFDLLEHSFGINESGPPPKLLPGTRANLLGFSAGRFSPSSNVSSPNEFDAAVLEALKRFSTLTESNNGLFMYETQSELLNCWSSEIRQVFANHMLNGQDWFPCHDATQVS